MSKALWPLLVRFFKFGVVGGSGVVVNLGLYALLTRACGLFDTLFERGLSYAVSVEISIITNFLLNDAWTFADRRESVLWRHRFLRFHLVSAVGFGVNWGVFTGLNWLMLEGSLSFLGDVTVAGKTFNVDDMLAACVGIVAATMWNFFGNLLWTWRK